ncbi:MAG: hypothetical protein LUE64_01310 [Candidatus Gastranaerophilales bacterium]|nr:hypothetical protein [Candidatus Gastranaerophilales bacterium]
MRALFFVLFVFMFCTLAAGADTTFIYLNGSNTNTEKSREDFVKGVYKLHKQVMKRFSNDELAFSYTGTINPEPIPFYWGDMSKAGIESIKEDFDFMKAISPKPARYVREFIALCLHDAIWVSKYQNMRPILEKLNKVVWDEYKKGNKVVLTGYSAGTFIVHEYLFTKMPVISLILKNDRVEVDDIFRKHLIEQNIKETCADAVFKSELVTYDLTGNFILEDDFNRFKEKASKLNNYTEKYCAPNNAVIGAINHASPFALFYSELFQEGYEMSDLMAYSYKYLVENNIFWLTVNFSDDPLGFPSSKNVTIDEVSKYGNIQISKGGGFIYDKSDKSSGRTFILAHLSYYKAAKRFSKMLVAAINEGHKYFYVQNGLQ